METFPNGILPDLTSVTLQNGLASDEWLQQQVRQLQTRGVLPSPVDLDVVRSAPFNSPESKDPLARFVERDNQFVQSLKAEYCFYEGRYFSALDRFLQSVADASLRGDRTATIQSRLDAARKLNQKLNVFTQLANQIAKTRYATTEQFQRDINTINASLQARGVQLLEQSKILEKETAAADLHKRMVEYTVEKNKANNNLLSLYAVLNIVALSMIFYIART